MLLKRALEWGFRPIVVINKIDRPGVRPDWVLDQTFELFDRLGAKDEQLDFPVVYASALQGYASENSDARDGNMDPLFRMIVDHVPLPMVDSEGPFQIQVSALQYNTYTGVIGVGRINRGRIQTNSPVTVVDRQGKTRNARILQLFDFLGLERIETEQAQAGDIIAFTGVDDLGISDTICEPAHVEAMHALTIDEPTVTMTFQVNKSPFAGKEGKFVTSRQIRERLHRELIHNVALRVDDTDDPDKFRVSGRGELHLSILIENMRREGYELGVSRPEVIIREIDGIKQEPYEQLTVDVEEQHQGSIMEKLGERRGDMQNMVPDGKGRVRIDFIIPSRGLNWFSYYRKI